MGGDVAPSEAMKVPPTGLNRGLIGWARPSPFTPLPFGSLLFAFHLLRRSLVYPRPTWECLCSHFSFPQLPSHVPTNLQALTPTLPLKFKTNDETYNCLGDATRGGIHRMPLIHSFPHHHLGVGGLR